LRSEYIKLLALFAGSFTPQVWRHAQVLLTGAILVRGSRTVTSILRVMGLSHETHFANYHRVLNRAGYSMMRLSRILLGVLIQVFVPDGELVIGGDETIERRRGDHIQAKGIYRDPVRSSQGHLVKASGLRWVTVMLLTRIPFAQRIWALPFMTVLAPSERYFQQRGRRHRKITDVMRLVLWQIRRWVPNRPIIFVADSSYAVLTLLDHARQLTLTMVTRFRMDAALYEPAPLPKPKQRGRPRRKGSRLPTLFQIAADPATAWTRHIVRDWYGQVQRHIDLTTGTAVWWHSGMPLVPIRWVIVRDPLGHFDTQAILCTDLSATPQQIIEWFIQRWQMEVTHREVREHLGVETQRQWSNKAIARTTPLLFGLFSIITVLAHRCTHLRAIRTAAWYAKPRLTFSDAIATVRYELWRLPTFHISRLNRYIAKLPAAIFNHFAFALCYSA
jgi:DDE superfamily endonuclease